MKIVILETNPESLGRAMQTLSFSGHLCYGAPSERTLKALLEDLSVDLVILDWEAPDMNRRDTLRWLNDSFPTTPVVLGVIEGTSEDDIVSGLAAGADIYIKKPLGSNESLLRINQLAQRISPGHRVYSDTFEFEQFRFHASECCVELHGRRISLTLKEFNLALLLFRNLPSPVTRQQIAIAMWGDDKEAKSRSIDTHICKIRVKLGLHPEHGYCLSSLYRNGYRLTRTRILPAAPASGVVSIPETLVVRRLA
ncbi:response regulator transcription factor [Collimonas silvisoli]|uniref:response regulator transcription factor n=1 Tax=Collimonas silvisoli TaxID=2825884 RepID=UPI001B8BE29A|nr:response regulator transcription factor [Collimonas silvisoli]